MMILGKERQKMIDGLRMNNSLKMLTLGQFVHEELEFRCLELKYSLESEDFSPNGIDLVPLWESDNSITGFYLDDKFKPVFIHYYVDDINDYKVIANSVYSLIDFLVEEYVDYDFEKEVREMLLNTD